VIIVSAVMLFHQPRARTIADNLPQTPIISVGTGDLNDEPLLQEVSERAPLMRATYEANLRDVNLYIKDAKASVEADPNDEEAQQALMDAYGQKSMIYEMALDRSLP